ncbi:hypothetical protein TNCV_1650951 [Trichonephila clavipes]|nr:hypothetical protein TNCV_1650951 [Trichonephila clavipes]
MENRNSHPNTKTRKGPNTSGKFSPDRAPLHSQQSSRENYIEKIVPPCGHNLLIPEQHGFRPDLSTTHQLLRVVETIKSGFKNQLSQTSRNPFTNRRAPLTSTDSGSLRSKRKLDWTSASEMNCLYPNSRRESINENKYLNSLPRRGEDGGRSGLTRTKLKYVTRAGMEERKEEGA